MAWYDLFSRVYDAQLEHLYREQRRLVVEALGPRQGDVVLDLPCGTGQSFELLAAAVGPTGRVVGVDLSPGMVRIAKQRIAQRGLANTSALVGDAGSLTLDVAPDCLHVFLGMSVFPDHERVFEHLWSLLAPGGRCVIADVHAETLSLQGRLVNLVARAEIRRRTWEPLERLGTGFTRRPLPTLPQHGGEMFLAIAEKPRSSAT